jgi:hypothetical protein
MMHKLFKYARISVVAIFFMVIVFSLCSTSVLGVPNTSLNMVNEDNPHQAALNTSKDDIITQTTSVLQPHSLTSSEPLPCFGPEIIAYVNKKTVEINQTVIITGIISPPSQNVSARICCVRPDYSWIEIYVPTDPKTGEFGPTEVVMDMKG